MKLPILLVSALLGLSLSAFAATTPSATPASQPAQGKGEHHYCTEHAQECKDNAAKFDSWCSANADKCTGFKAWAEKHIEFCSAHEKECAEHHEKRHEKMEERCAQNPDKPRCKDMKNNDEMGGDALPPA